MAAYMQQMKNQEVRKRLQMEKMAKESDEIKELNFKIQAATINRERAAQIVEKQYRQQVELETQTKMEVQMLRQKEQQDLMFQQKQQ